MATQCQTPDYPTEYRGNTIHDEKRVGQLRDGLLMTNGTLEVHSILDDIGVEYDADSVVLEDSYNCLFVDTENGDYSEVWATHKKFPSNARWAVRLL